MTRAFYSVRNGLNPNSQGLPLRDIAEMFGDLYAEMYTDGMFDQAFGFHCVDAGSIQGTVKDINLRILLDLRKRDLWPISQHHRFYSEDDLLDMIEFLHQYVSKPLTGTPHNYNNCGMHWQTFSSEEGQKLYRDRVNALLKNYAVRFEISQDGEVLQGPEDGFEQIVSAEVPTGNKLVRARVASALKLYRRHGATLDDRRNAVRELADAFELVRDKAKKLLTSKDESDLFNIANNFGVRHANDQQKSKYDASIWLSWMFYFYLSTIHTLLRRIEADESAPRQT